EFDRVGVGLISWEFLSAVVILFVVPFAERGEAASAFRLLIANLVGLGTALIAWLITLALTPKRRRTARSEDLHDFVKRQVETSRAQRFRAESKRM
ncbi:MAG: hypothetical protein ACYS8K_05490, partial [Planctomycetota bacterium]